MHAYTYRVTFGDCDPAGIVYYPNILKWVDTAFHDFLHLHGGHDPVCAKAGSAGLGLIDVSIQFRSPMVNGDYVTIRFEEIEWATRTFTVRYQGFVGERLAFEAKEVRGVFKQQDGRMSAGETADLRAILCPTSSSSG